MCIKISNSMNNKGVVLIIGLVIGISVFLFFKITQKHPKTDDTLALPTLMNVIEVNAVDFVFKAEGFGISRPVQTWNAITNVSGHIVKVHPNLKSGVIFRKGTELMAIDPSRYQLAIEEAKSDLASVIAELAQLTIDRESLEASLSLSTERLNLMEKELSRVNLLARNKSISASERDEQLLNTITARQEVQSLKDQLLSIPTRYDILQAKKQQVQVKLKQARNDLEDTLFIAPYDLRITEVNVDLHQFVNSGSVVFSADNIDKAEVEANIPFNLFRYFMQSQFKSNDEESHLINRLQFLKFDDINAEVRLAQSPNIIWAAKVQQVANGLDIATRSARVVVVVSDPYHLGNNSTRPALQSNMYVRVLMSVPSHHPLIVIPTSAIHQGEVYVVDESDRLKRQKVEVSFEQRGLSVISTGLVPGDIIVTDDLSMALTGMPVKKNHNIELEKYIREAASGVKL